MALSDIAVWDTLDCVVCAVLLVCVLVVGVTSMLAEIFEWSLNPDVLAALSVAIVTASASYRAIALSGIALRGMEGGYALAPLFIIDVVGVTAFFNATGLLLQSRLGLGNAYLWIMAAVTVFMCFGLKRGAGSTPLSSWRWWRWR